MLMLWQVRRWLRNDATGKVDGTGRSFQVTEIGDRESGVVVGCYSEGIEVYATKQWVEKGSKEEV